MSSINARLSKGIFMKRSFADKIILKDILQLKDFLMISCGFFNCLYAMAPKCWLKFEWRERERKPCPNSSGSTSVRNRNRDCTIFLCQPNEGEFALLIFEYFQVYSLWKEL